jgi:ankyrin repeat protein
MKAASPIQGESVGQTLMGNAVTFDKPEVVRLLIRRGYDVKTDAARLLDHARGRPEIERILHEAGAVAPPRAAPARRAAGSAPAHLPPPAPHKALSPDEARQALRARNVDLSTDKTMLDAFLTAVMHQDDETALLFLDAGVSPNARREPPQNDTPLLAAVFGGCKAADPAQNARMEALIAAMLAKGAEPNTKADNGNPALSYAVGECTPGAIRALVKAGADMKTKNRAGLTAMALAVSDGRADNVKALLDLGYDVTAERAMLLQWSEGKPEIQRLLRGTASPKR